MAALLSTQLDSLRRERDRLDELLMLDANWRSLRVLDARVGAGERLEDLGGPERRAELVHALASNRIYAARAKLLETIDLLASATQLPDAPQAGSLSSRIVMLDADFGDTFRTRVRVRVKDQSQAAELPVPRMPDPLQLIDGLGRCAVELLHDGGITRFDEIAGWTSADVTSWRNRLDGCVHGTPGFWIEQAACLAAGRPTRFSERARRGEFAALVPPPGPEPARIDEASTAGPQTVTPPAAQPPSSAWPRSAAEELPGNPARDLTGSRDIGRPGSRTVSPPSLAPATRFSVPVPTAIRIELPAVLGRNSPLAELSSARRAGHAPVRPRPAADIGVRRPADRPRTLLQRLEDIRETKRFEATTYAAYRSNVEEASVTIVRAGDAPAVQTPPTDAPPREVPPATRFLRALTGKTWSRDT